MTAFQFAADHPFVAMLMFWLACWVVVSIVAQPFRFWNRWLRHRNIIAHGWPKPPLDADGDVILPKAEDKPS